MQIQKSFAKQGNENSSGMLYLVATPIGNLEDMTFRAVRILQEVDVIAAEDTRQTLKLLTHFQISKKLISYHTHNLKRSGEHIIHLLQNGSRVALVSDAGLPNISDPGFELVQQAIKLHIPVVPIPGANAALTSLIASGLSTVRFRFIGFLPREKKLCIHELEKLQHASETLLFYEAPHRLEKTLTYMEQIWGGHRSICIARELTKTYEEFIRGNMLECKTYVQQTQLKGEICVIVEGEEISDTEQTEPWWHQMTIAAHTLSYIDKGIDKKEAMKKVATERNLSKREVYQSLLQNK